MIDLRSDTVTRPTKGMLEAMSRAEVGDDVLRDDPTVNSLEERAAEFLGQEAALFTPSGTMANQVALKSWTQPSNEVIVERWSHSYNYEVAAGAALSGLSFWPIDTDDGILTPEQVGKAIRPANIHLPITRVVSIENTHNRASGACYPLERVRELGELAHAHDLALHMDGARLANAAAATGVPASQYGKFCDSVTLCLSKGLGCPVGSVVAGPKDFIERARRCRKMFGGGMRQAGYLAAAGVYALEHHVERLAEDHANARRLGEGIAAIDGLQVNLDRVVTNMVYCRFQAGPDTAKQVMEAARAEGVLAILTSPDTARMVTHLDVDAKDIDRAIAVFSKLMA